MRLGRQPHVNCVQELLHSTRGPQQTGLASGDVLGQEQALVLALLIQNSPEFNLAFPMLFNFYLGANKESSVHWVEMGGGGCILPGN